MIREDDKGGVGPAGSKLELYGTVCGGAQSRLCNVRGAEADSRSQLKTWQPPKLPGHQYRSKYIALVDRSLILPYFNHNVSLYSCHNTSQPSNHQALQNPGELLNGKFDPSTLQKATEAGWNCIAGVLQRQNTI